jgi:hypothetical protein
MWGVVYHCLRNFNVCLSRVLGSGTMGVRHEMTHVMQQGCVRALLIVDTPQRFTGHEELGLVLIQVGRAMSQHCTKATIYRHPTENQDYVVCARTKGSTTRKTQSRTHQGSTPGRQRLTSSSNRASSSCLPSVCASGSSFEE